MPTSSHLDRFATSFARSVLEGRSGPSIAGFPGGGDPPVIVPLGEHHPLEVLWSLPSTEGWDAIVVVAAGRLVGIASPAGAVAPPPAIADGPVVVASITGRCGPDRSVLIDRHGRALLARADVEGLVPDACRRALGRDTAPPDRPVTAWWATEWLTEVLLRAGAPGERGSLAEVVSHHPAVDLEELPSSTVELVSFVVERGWDHAHLTGWDGVRRSVAEGLLPDQTCPPALAEWFDAGSFSRHALASRPSAVALLADGRGVLSPGVIAAVQRILAAWRVGSGR